jgi:HTH-type transcriptional regulator / antitoxin HipB
MSKKSKIVTFEEHLEKRYGKRGTKSRQKYEQGFEAFKLGVILQEMRKAKGLTQDELAQKCGTTKTYISRIENDASDIRLSTLMRIFSDGFGKRLRFTY